MTQTTFATFEKMFIRLTTWLIYMIVGLYLTTNFALAQQTLPKWEFGLGPSLLSYPDYPGSSEQNQLILPFPYISYRSDDLTIDQREISRPIIDLAPFELDLSMSISVPVSSKDNHKRNGMDDLDGAAGLGPVFRYSLYRQHLNELKFEWPIQAVLATDFRSIHQEGWKTSPGIYYYFRRSFANDQRLKITLGTHAEFSSAQYNNYFYGVRSFETTATRPAYQTTDGFSNMAYSLRLNWHFGNFWFGGFYKLQDFKNAVYASSPLLEQTRSETYGLMLT